MFRKDFFFTLKEKEAEMVTVFDNMQSGYEYAYSAPAGLDFDPGFTPDLTPKEMLELGVFEGHYMTDCRNEFPPDWFEKAKLSAGGPDVSCNYFKVRSRQSLGVWRKKGWILEPDPRGWFQWYCRYYMGRRIAGLDQVQIKRWRAFRRHKAQIEHHCLPLDISCRIRQRQALLQWAYDPFI